MSELSKSSSRNYNALEIDSRQKMKVGKVQVSCIMYEIFLAKLQLEREDQII